MTLQHRIVRRELVEITEGWIVETRPVEEIGIGALKHRDQTDVYHVRRMLAHYVHAKQSHVAFT
ncbi:MAG TPA: hypothetical protein VIZ30_10765, partial [Pseudomonadales bacterium]